MSAYRNLAALASLGLAAAVPSTDADANPTPANAPAPTPPQEQELKIDAFDNPPVVDESPAIDTVPEVRDLVARALGNDPFVFGGLTKDSESGVRMGDLIAIFDWKNCDGTTGFNGALLSNPKIEDAEDMSPDEIRQLSFMRVIYGRYCPDSAPQFEDPNTLPHLVFATTEPDMYNALHSGWVTLRGRLERSLLNPEEKEGQKESKTPAEK